MIQGGEVNHFDDLGREGDALVAAVAVLRGQQRQEWSDALTAGTQQIPRCGVRQPIRIVKVRIEAGLDSSERRIQPLQQFTFFCRRGQCIREPERLRDALNVAHSVSAFGLVPR